MTDNKIVLGNIYAYSKDGNIKYIGSTKYDNVNDRHKLHMKDYKRYVKILDKIKNKEKLTTGEQNFGCCNYLYNSFHTYGLENFNIIIIEKWDVNSILKREDEWILKYNTLRPNGYNLRLNNTTDSYYFTDEVKEKISKSVKNAMSKSINSFRIHKNELLNLPMGVQYVINPKGNNPNMKGYIIKNDRCECKYIISDTRTLDDLKEETIKFISNLENTNSVYKSKISLKLETGIPKGIVEYSYGKFQVKTTLNKIAYLKTYYEFDRNINLANAIKYLYDLKTKLGFLYKLKKDNSSETSNQLGLMIYIDIKGNIFTYIDVPSDLKV